MTEDIVHDALASTFEEFTVHERLHAVPPHAVHAVTVDGRRAVCKVATGPESVLPREAAAQAHAARETCLPVPDVLAAGEAFSVAEWSDGLPEPGAGEPSTAWARAAGAGLATLHVETAFDAHGLPRARGGGGQDGVPGLAVDAADSPADALAAALRSLRAGVVDTGYAGVLDDAADFLAAHPESLAGAGDPVLCHGNWLPDHVGVADDAAGADGVTAVVDFERTLVAPGEYDYWRAAVPLFAGADDAAPAREAFRAGYESVRPLPDGFERRGAVYRLAVTASFVESLFVQDQHDPAATERKAGALRDHVDGALADLRERYG